MALMEFVSQLTMVPVPPAGSLGIVRCLLCAAVIDTSISLSIRHFRNKEKETGNEMRPTVVSGIVIGDGNKNGKKAIECFHMTSRRSYWCPKTMKRRPCWCPKPILRELNSFLMQTPFFVPINLHRCWPREWKHSIGLDQQNNNFARASRFFVYFFAVVARLRRKTS